MYFGVIRVRITWTHLIHQEPLLTASKLQTLLQDWDWVGFNVPLNTSLRGQFFAGQMTQPTVLQSTEGSSSPKDRLQSHQVHLTVLQTYACIQYTVIHNIQMNLSTVKWAQWNKTQSRELLGLFICVCIALCTIVAQNIAQNRPDNFPSYPPDNHHCSDDVYLREGGYCL